MALNNVNTNSSLRNVVSSISSTGITSIAVSSLTGAGTGVVAALANSTNAASGLVVYDGSGNQTVP